MLNFVTWRVLFRKTFLQNYYLNTKTCQLSRLSNSLKGARGESQWREMMRGREVGGREAGPDLSTATDLQPSTFNRQKASQMKVLPSYLCLNQLNHCLDTRNKLSQRRLASLYLLQYIYTFYIIQFLSYCKYIIHFYVILNIETNIYLLVTNVEQRNIPACWESCHAE